MKYYKPLLIILLTLISTSIFAQEYDLDSLVKTHKRVAILPVKVVYNHEKLKEGVTLESVINREFSDGFLIQNDLFNYLQEEKKSLKIEVQPINETNSLLAENAITLKDLEELPADVVAKALQVDGIIEIEISRKSYFAQVGNSGTNTDAAVDAAVKGFLTGNPLYLVLAVASAGAQNTGEENVLSGTTIISKMVISDGKTGEIIKKYTNGLIDGSLNSTFRVIEKVFWTNFKKAPITGNE